MIDILIPVLGRPQNAAPLVQNIRDTTTVPFKITFVCSPEDTEQINEVMRVGGEWTQMFAIGSEGPVLTVIMMKREAGPGDYAHKINTGFREGDAEWVFQAADDLTFQPGWAENALKIADSGPGYDVVATNDMANANVRKGQFGTHNLIRRRYVTAHGGQVLHEGYDHNFVDRELSGWAQSRGVFRFAPHSRVKHNHPLWKTAPDDPTYRKSLARFQDDRRLFLSRAHLWGYHGLSAQERKLAA
jgi:hypothetical protein